MYMRYLDDFSNLFSGVYYFLFVVSTESSFSRTVAEHSMKEKAEWHF